MKDLTHLILPDLREMLPEMDKAAIEEVFEDFHAADIADILENVDDASAVRVFEALPLPRQVSAFEHLEEPEQLRLMERVGRDKMIKVVEQMSSDDRVDFLQALPERTVESILPLLAQAERNDIKKLLQYEEGTTGSVMTTEYASLSGDATVSEALAHLRKIAPERETIYELFVLDADRHLLGRLGLRRLVLAKPEQKVADIMTPPPVTVHASDDQETVARAFEKYDLLAIPVLDAEERLCGIVTHDDVLDIIEEEATEDAQKLGGMETLDEPYLESGFRTMIRKRAGWLTVLFLGEMLTATAMVYFEKELAAALVLSLFIPLIISSGGNSGSQATTLVIRAMALGEVRLRDWWRVARREIGAGLALGGILGVIGIIRILLAAIWFPVYGEHVTLIGLTVGFSLVGVVLWGTLIGSMLPFLLRSVGIDPASASAPFVATLVDVFGLVIYFSVAKIILSGTLL